MCAALSTETNVTNVPARGLLLPLTSGLTLIAAIVVVIVVVVIATVAAGSAAALPDAVELFGNKLPGAWPCPRLQGGSSGQQADVVRAYQRKQPAHRTRDPHGCGSVAAPAVPAEAGLGWRQVAAGGGWCAAVGGGLLALPRCVEVLERLLGRGRDRRTRRAR